MGLEGSEGENLGGFFCFGCWADIWGVLGPAKAQTIGAWSAGRARGQGILSSR